MDSINTYAQMIRLLAVLPNAQGAMPQPGPVRHHIRDHIREADRPELEAILIETLVALSKRGASPLHTQGSEIGVGGHITAGSGSPKRRRA